MLGSEQQVPDDVLAVMVGTQRQAIDKVLDALGPWIRPVAVVQHPPIKIRNDTDRSLVFSVMEEEGKIIVHFHTRTREIPAGAFQLASKEEVELKPDNEEH